MNWLTGLLQRLLVGEERVLARRAIKGLQPPDVDRRRFERELVGRVRPRDVLLNRIKTGSGRWAAVRLAAERLCRLHLAVAGASGSGKSRWLTNVLLQILRWAGASVVVMDAKSETACDLRDIVVPYLIAITGDETILDRLRIINPFDTSTVTPLNLTLPEAGTNPQIQAFGIVSALEEALAEPLAPPSRHALLRLTCAAISLGEPLTRLQAWLAEPATFVRAAMRSSDVEVREYARVGFPRENQQALRAISTRLGALCFVPETRRSLEARSCIGFRDGLEQSGSLTIVDVGSPPSGNEQLMRFWGGPLLGKLTRAALSRPVGPAASPAVVVLEELPEIAGAHEARSLARLMSVARFRSTAVWTTGQSRSQLLKVDRNLVEAIATNAGLQVQFRASLADAQAFAHLLPDSAGATSHAAARREQIEELTRLPQRHCYLALRDAPFRARRVLAPRVDLDAMRRTADQLPGDVRERARLAGLPEIEIRSETVEPMGRPLPDVTEPPAEEPGSFPALG